MGDKSIFMDMETYEQYKIDNSQIKEERKFFIPNLDVQLDFVDSKLIRTELPATVELKVESTEPMIKGATATGSSKPATMETGLVVTVPNFIQEGEILIITTANSEYKSRA